jgi:hypothetical protein
MAIRRINFTGRKSINKKDFKIAVFPSRNGVPEFDASINLEHYKFPSDASVVIEAYRETTWMRFECGTINKLQIPNNRLLSEFETEQGIKFRIKVISHTYPSGVLLGEADQIKPKSPDSDEDKTPLLPVLPNEDLDQNLYKLDFEFGPKLLINPIVGNWRSFAVEPSFIALVLPNILREILTRVIISENHLDMEDISDWRTHWLLMAVNLPGIKSLSSDSDIDQQEEWIDEVISAFCRYNRIADKFSEVWITGDGYEG